MTADIYSGRELQQSLVRAEFMQGPPTDSPPRCRLICVSGPDPMLLVNRALHVRTLTGYGFGCDDVTLPEETTLDQLADVIDAANRDSTVDGVMVLLPLPPHLPISQVLPLISPDKELEGLHPDHAATLLATVPASERTVRPLVPEALVAAVSEVGVDLRSCTVVILTEPQLMSTNPVANLVARVAGPAVLPMDAPVSIVPVDHPRARDLARTADLLIVSLERPAVVDDSYIRAGAVVVDFNPTLVGSVEVDGQLRPVLKGGVDTDSVAAVASILMPAPGGVGPVMLGILMRNLIRAARRRAPVAA